MLCMVTPEMISEKFFFTLTRESHGIILFNHVKNLLRYWERDTVRFNLQGTWYFIWMLNSFIYRRLTIYPNTLVLLDFNR